MKYGKIKIREDCWFDFWKSNNSVTPFKVEFLNMNKEYYMECEHPMFDDLKEGDYIPEYVVTYESVLDNENDNVIYKQIVKSVERLKNDN